MARARELEGARTPDAYIRGLVDASNDARDGGTCFTTAAFISFLARAVDAARSDRQLAAALGDLAVFDSYHADAALAMASLTGAIGGSATNPALGEIIALGRQVVRAAGPPPPFDITPVVHYTYRLVDTFFRSRKVPTKLVDEACMLCLDLNEALRGAPGSVGPVLGMQPCITAIDLMGDLYDRGALASSRSRQRLSPQLLQSVLLWLADAAKARGTSPRGTVFEPPTRHDWYDLTMPLAQILTLPIDSERNFITQHMKSGAIWRLVPAESAPFVLTAVGKSIGSGLWSDETFELLVWVMAFLKFNPDFMSDLWRIADVGNSLSELVRLLRSGDPAATYVALFAEAVVSVFAQAAGKGNEACRRVGPQLLSFAFAPAAAPSIKFKVYSELLEGFVAMQPAHSGGKRGPESVLEAVRAG